MQTRGAWTFEEARFFRDGDKELVELYVPHDPSVSPVRKITEEDKARHPQAYAAFRERGMSGKVEQVGEHLEGFVKRIDDLVESAKKELDGAETEVKDAVGMTKDFAVGVRGAANKIRGMLKGNTNSPPVEEPKKGLFK